MKKLLIIGLVATMLVTGGMFAATYTTATATIGVTAPTSDFATVTAEDVTSLAPLVFGKYNGTWPSGDLFTITPDPAYTGDLVIRVYLVNTGALRRYYEHLNMTMQFTDNTSAVADEQGIAQGDFQVLTLDNSEVLFTWANSQDSDNYSVELTGGGFKLHPWKTLTGGSVQPQLWMEIKQR